MYKNDLVLNDLEWLIYHKTKPKQTKTNQTSFDPRDELADKSIKRNIHLFSNNMSTFLFISSCF